MAWQIQHWLLCVTGVICCLWIAVDDFRRREAHVVPLLVLGISGGLLRWLISGKAMLPEAGINLAFVAVINFVVVAWFRITRGTPVMDRLLGWGDVLMFAALALWLKPPAFAILYIAGTWAVLAGTLVYRKLAGPQQEFSIPLAGWLGVVSMVLIPLLGIFGKGW